MDTSDYEKAVKNSIKVIKSLKSILEDTADQSETNKNKTKVLAESYNDAEDKVKTLTKAFNKAAKEEDITADRTKELARQLEDAEKECKDLKSQLDNVSTRADKAGKDFKKLGSAIKTGLQGAGKVGVSALKGIASAAGLVVGALVTTAETTRDYRNEMSKLDTAFKTSGFNSDTATKAYKELVSVIGETDQSVEAAQQIALLSKSEEDVAKWANLAAGVVGRFGDALQPETFYESA